VEGGRAAGARQQGSKAHGRGQGKEEREERLALARLLQVH